MQPSSPGVLPALVGLDAFCHSSSQTEPSWTLWYLWLHSHVALAAEGNGDRSCFSQQLSFVNSQLILWSFLVGHGRKSCVPWDDEDAVVADQLALGFPPVRTDNLFPPQLEGSRPAANLHRTAACSWGRCSPVPCWLVTNTLTFIEMLNFIGGGDYPSSTLPGSKTYKPT